MIEYRSYQESCYETLKRVEYMPKPRLQITIRKDLKEWLDAQIKELRFADYSHAVEVAVLELKKKIEKEKKE